MIIDIREGNLRCYSPEELLRIMTLEKMEKCHIDVSSMGCDLATSVVSIADVRNWIELNGG